MTAPESRLPGPDESPGFLLWRVTLAWQRVMRAALAPHDLTHVQFVLLTTTWWLTRSGEPPTQRQLAEQAGTDTMMTSQVVRKLADRGLLTRADDPADARAKRVQLTEAGSALVAKALHDVEDADARFFGGLGERTGGFVSALAELGT
ncbi:MarR family winged helix-turn-helix transcriptional regulator [Amycolatopsis sp. NPDC005232]|uniref:MarR family winged helix-turn-helix transcriptional regulator n=1 Tax=unclassified Amycolatopsis TaxID=2618356 RepID=UPI001C69D303|nr:MarR family winged helix-turn-helix transcriptional regulator [Amycolatopsis sp. DSM 110486]QYN22771.1 MarR family winged helix-turn-helix transcriptional regulator [Amycolatopsis sp. DSM 110486]